MSAKTYHFEEVRQCEMCGDESARHKVIGIRLNRSQGLRPKEKTGIGVTVKKCTNCNLIYTSPLPIPLNLQDHYGIPPESYWHASYFEWDPTHFSHQLSILQRLMGVKPQMRALDIGAGLGKSMLSLEKAGFDTYGIEPSKSFHERAISKMNIRPEKLRMEMIEEADFPMGFFDFITFGAVFEHMYHPARCLEKALGWLKPDGIIHMEVPSSKYLISKLINQYYRLIGTHYVTNLSPMHEPFHLYEFGLRSFEQLGKTLNFKVEFHEYFICDIYLLPKILHAPLKYIMKRSDSGMQLSVYLKKL